VGAALAGARHAVAPAAPGRAPGAAAAERPGRRRPGLPLLIAGLPVEVRVPRAPYRALRVAEGRRARRVEGRALRVAQPPPKCPEALLELGRRPGSDEGGG